jgi:MFS transporter, PPP family, 3-phenylpropionic acid transporter
VTAGTRRSRAAADLRRLQVLYGAIGAGVGSLLPFLVLYLTWRGLSAPQAGLVLGLMSGVGVLAVPAWGVLADRFLGVVRALRLSCLLAAVAALVLLAAGSSVPAIFACAALLSAARAPGEALADTLTVLTLRGSAPRYYGQVRLWASVGFALAVGVWGVVLSRTSLALILVAYPGAMLAVIASAGGSPTPSAGPRPSTPSVGPRPSTPSAGPRPSTASRRAPQVIGSPFAVVLAGALLFGVSMGASITLLPLRITDLGGDVAMVGAASVVGALAEIPLMRSSAHLQERFGARSVFLLGGAMFGAAQLLYGAIALPVGCVAVSAVRGAGYALVYVGLVTWVGTLLPADRQGRGQALLQTTLAGVAPIMGASLGGLAYANEPPVLVFGVAGALALVGTGISCVGASGRLHRRGSARIEH